VTKPRGRPRSDDLLTPAEWRVLEGVRHGMTNPEIARRQEVSIDAVKYHVANALQKLGMSSRGELRVWDGVRRDSALHRKALAMNNGITLGPIGQVSRTVKDIAAARAWYADALGLSHLYSFGNLAFFDCGGLRLFLSEGEGGASDSILYFRVDDVRAAHAALAARGIEFTHAPHLIHTHADGTEEWMAFFRDNEGRALALMSQVAPQG
jgi:DNA-binding CsgD family transcriptional regulator/catechol 2,3-dioxygenase-like lactoylglutathione lyase family enzyme